MSEPKRGEHNDICLKMNPSCRCNSCANDKDLHCETVCDATPIGECPIRECPHYIKDEPTKKGADHD